jgi:hypothetical protein
MQRSRAERCRGTEQEKPEEQCTKIQRRKEYLDSDIEKQSRRIYRVAEDEDTEERGYKVYRGAERDTVKPSAS